MRFSLTIVAVGLCLIVAGVAMAEVTGQWRVQLIRGSTTVGQGVGDTEAAAWTDCQAKIPRSSTSPTVYACQTMRYYATVMPDPIVCPPAPAPQTRQATCPAGTTGTWTQTGISTVGAAPACTATTTWATTPPADACPPDLLPAPANVVALGIDTRNIRVTWTAVPGASAYVFDRCIGATCTPYFMSCVPGTVVTHGPFQSDGLTARYRVRPSRDATCGTDVGNLGTYSATVTGVAQAAPIPNPPVPDPPAPSPSGTASLSWSPPTQNVDGSTLNNLAGYRISYGTISTGLTSTIQVPGPNVSTATVSGLTPGTYFFAVRAYTSTGTESANSAAISKTIQ